jgi:DNA-binding Lrp family transcriptional regulator
MSALEPDQADRCAQEWCSRFAPCAGPARGLASTGRRSAADATPADRTGVRDEQTAPVTVGIMVHAFVLIDAEPARVADLAVELAALQRVSEVYSVAGHADIVAVVRVRHHEELADVVTREISQLPGITETRTLIAFQAYSRHDLDAIWDLGTD